jgi:4-amino-4-deoxy-L-arabinose transferase-like glycosyltransferase
LGTAALIYLAARRLGGRGAGAAAAFTVLLHPYFAFYASRVLTETLALFFLAIFLTFYLDRTAGPLKLGSAGAALALAALGRPVFLYLGALAGICLLLRARGEPWRKRLAHAGALAGAFVVVLTPWTARNFALSGRVIPVTEISGRILYQGNRVLITEEEPPRPKTLIRGEEFRARVAPFANEPVAVELAFQDLLREKALRAISEHPTEFFLLSLRRFGHMFILRPTLAPGVRGRPSSEFVQAGVTTFSILLYAAAAVGFFAVPGRLPKFFLPFACLLNLSLHSLSISLLRYRLPTDLLLALVAGFGVVFIWEKARRRGRAEGGAD